MKRPIWLPNFLPIRCLGILVLAVLACTGRGASVAESVLEYSGIQGQDGWRYGRFGTAGKPSTYEDFGHYSGGRWQPTSSLNNPYMTQNGAHPGWSGTYAHHSAVRQYTIQPGEEGLLSFSGTVEHVQTGGGDGTISRIYVNNMPVYSQHSKLTQYPYSRNAVVEADDIISMEIAENGNPSYDRTAFTMTAEPVTDRILVADSRTEFSSVQDASPGGWQYGEYSSGTTFTTTGWSWTGSQWDGPESYQRLHATGGHSGDALGDAVRRWTSDVEGTVFVEGGLYDVQTGGGNGVIGRIYHNGSEIWSYTIPGDGGAPSSFSLVLDNVSYGDIFDFQIDANGDYGWDNTAFWATFTQVPEPGGLLVVALLGVIALRRPVR